MLPTICFFLWPYACATQAHLYPVCFFNAAPLKQEVSDYYGPRLIAAIHVALNDQNVPAAVTPDARWVVANVSQRQDKKVAAVWPRLACIGDALDSLTTKQEMDCVAYVQNFVTNKSYLRFGNAKDAGGFDIWNESPVEGTLVRCRQAKDVASPGT